MKCRLVLCLLAALIWRAVPVHAAEGLEPGGGIALSSGYVLPQSGTCDTRFTYGVSYLSAANIRPEHVWVGIWWGSRGTRYWYELHPFDPSDTDYRDGAWYVFDIEGLDCSAHFFRFVAEVGSVVRYWPEPEANYAPGPTVTGMPVRNGTVSAISASGPQPSLLLQADKAQVKPGGYVTFTVTVSLPSGHSEPARGVTVAYRPDPMFEPVAGTAPALILNLAIARWTRGSVRSDAVAVRIEGRSVPTIPAGEIFISQCGDLAPGQTVSCTFRCRAR